jgi:hypothetical protein
VPFSLSPPPEINVVYDPGKDKVASSSANLITFGEPCHAQEAELSSHHFEKLFSTSDANELVPALEVLIRDLQVQANALRERILEFVRADERVDSMRLEEIINLHPELGPLSTRMGEIAHQIESMGCFLKDIDQGLIDFPCEIGDEVVFLCWQFGESHVIAWHPIEGGFGDRRPIPGAPPNYLN